MAAGGGEGGKTGSGWGDDLLVYLRKREAPSAFGFTAHSMISVSITPNCTAMVKQVDRYTLCVYVCVCACVCVCECVCVSVNE